VGFSTFWGENFASKKEAKRKKQKAQVLRKPKPEAKARFAPIGAPGTCGLRPAAPGVRHHLMYNESLELTAPQHTAVKI
jgi:hypothetical protein